MDEIDHVKTEINNILNLNEDSGFIYKLLYESAHYYEYSYNKTNNYKLKQTYKDCLDLYINAMSLFN